MRIYLYTFAHICCAYACVYISTYTYMHGIHKQGVVILLFNCYKAISDNKRTHTHLYAISYGLFVFISTQTQHLLAHIHMHIHDYALYGMLAGQ